MTIDSSSFSCLMALCSAGQRLAGGGLAPVRQPTIFVLANCAWGKLVLLRPFSNAATISAIGTFLGAGAKFRPLARMSFSAVDNDLEESFHPHRTLRQTLVNLKDRIPLQQRAGVVHRISCGTCSWVYVGQTWIWIIG